MIPIRPLLFSAAAAGALAAGSVALADGDYLRPVTDPLTKAECGECHMAFPAGLLPARSWERIMANLEDHFGDNASLPADDTAAITAYLTANAGWDRGYGGEAPIRFMETRGFAHEHRRFTPERLKARGIKSIVDCAACHRGAEQGYYDDD